jgi:hypothetical protein
VKVTGPEREFNGAVGASSGENTNTFSRTLRDNTGQCTYLDYSILIPGVCISRRTSPGREGEERGIAPNDEPLFVLRPQTRLIASGAAS